MARIATIYSRRFNAPLQLCTMDSVRWMRVSEALARRGHQVDMIIPSAVPELTIRENLRYIACDHVRWDDYDVVKTLFHGGFAYLQQLGGEGHLFIISKLGSVVAREPVPGDLAIPSGALMLNPSTHFTPLRMAAYVRNEVEMEVIVRNEGQEERWEEEGLSGLAEYFYTAILTGDNIGLAPSPHLARFLENPNINLTKSKVTENYVNSMLVKTLALRSGFDEAVILDPEGFVAECTGENLFLLREGVLYTPPRAIILEGITRDAVITLASDMNIPIVEEMITRDQLYIADEVFITGTAAEIVPVRSYSSLAVLHHLNSINCP